MTSPPKRTPHNRMKAPRPNAGISASYERNIRSMSHQMGQDYLTEITQFYREIRQEYPERKLGDASPQVQASKTLLSRLRERWVEFFSGRSQGVASEFIRQASGYQAHAFRRAIRDYSRITAARVSERPYEWRKKIAPKGNTFPSLGPTPTPEEEQEALEALYEHEATTSLRNVGERRDGGWIGWENERHGPLPSLPSDLTPEGQERVKTIEEAAVEQNVGLIKSIPQQFHDRVAQDVLTALQDGWPLDDLVEKLRHNYGITRKRAGLIANDQNRGITGRLNVAQALAAWGEDAEGIWRHVHGGEKQPRKSHVEADGKRFRLSEGCWIDGEYILPGQKIGCQCWFEICPPGID